METKNIHVPGLYHLVSRIIKEFQFSQSANSSMLNQADLIRAKSFFSAIRAHLFMIGDPGILDLPENDPVSYPLREMPILNDIENQVFAQLSLLMKSLLVELTRSQSSRNSSGLNKHDRKRIIDLVQEAETFLSNSEKIQPLDLVESSPRAPLQGEGLNTLGNS